MRKFPGLTNGVCSQFPDTVYTLFYALQWLLLESLLKVSVGLFDNIRSAAIWIVKTDFYIKIRFYC